MHDGIGTTTFQGMRSPQLPSPETKQGIAANVQSLEFTGRGAVIRTPDILLPKQARYQAALRPVSIFESRIINDPE